MPVQPIIKNYYTAEINLPSVGANIEANFLEVPALNNAMVYGIVAYAEEDLAVSPQNKTLVSALGAANILCTFYDESKQKAFQQPYLDLRPATNGGLYRLFDPFKINITKSKVVLTSGTNLTAAESVYFAFIFYYL